MLWPVAVGEGKVKEFDDIVVVVVVGGILRCFKTDLERPRAVDIFFSLCWQLHKFHHAESLLRAVGVIHHRGALDDEVFKVNFLKLQFLLRRRLLS